MDTLCEYPGCEAGHPENYRQAPLIATSGDERKIHHCERHASLTDIAEIAEARQASQKTARQ